MRDVFVGTLIALAACLVAYQGMGELEDYNLNGAGFYAVFVALVPTGFPRLMEELRTNPLPGATSPADYVWFLRIALTAVLLLCGLLFAMEVRSGRVTRLMTQSGRLVVTFVVITGSTLVAFLALTMTRLWCGPASGVTMEGLRLGPLTPSIHDLAAYFLIGSLAIAVLTNTWPFHGWRDLKAAGRRPYLPIFLGMTVGAALVAFVVSKVAPGHVVIVVEWWEILMFGLFWSFETRRITRLRAHEVIDNPGNGPLKDPPRALVPAP